MQFGPLIFLFVVSALLLVGGLVVAMARQLLRPPRMTDGKAVYVLKRLGPDDVGLTTWEPISFHVPESDQSGTKLRIAGWWIPAATPTDRCCVLLHGYADAKVGALAWAPLWHAMGFNLLLLDLRAHGESDGKLCTGGVQEAQDVGRVIDQLKLAREPQTRSLMLFGVSLGAAVAAAVAAGRDDIAGVVMESVFVDYPTAARAHARVMGAPLPSLHGPTIALAERIAGVRFDSARPLDTIARAACPVMLIHGDADPFVSTENWSKLSGVVMSRNNPADRTWVADGAGHVLALAAEPAEYEARLREFVEQVTKGRPENPGA